MSIDYSKYTPPKYVKPEDWAGLTIVRAEDEDAFSTTLWCADGTIVFLLWDGGDASMITPIKET